MQIKLLKAWNMTDAGRVLDVPKPVADLLIGRKVAVAIEAKAISEPPADKSLTRAGARAKIKNK